ncbi:UvrD-helicase domain-containing protein [Micromonosporaceae bacterium Da 78-11]
MVRRPPATVPPRQDDPLQRYATEHTDGPLLVIGGPGTGKTTVLVEAVAARIADGVDPERILVLTFGRRGATALRDRIEARIAGDPGRIVHEPLVRTFHAYAFGLLRRAAAERGEPSPRLLTGPEQDLIIRELLAVVGDPDATDEIGWPEALRPALPTRAFAQQLRDLMQRAAERGIGPVQLARLGEQLGLDDWPAAARFLREYVAVLALRDVTTRGSTAYDPAELVRAAAGLLADDPELLEAERRRVQFVYVDELADTDPAQIDLLSLIAGGGKPLVAFADPDSSVYGFRGADPAAVAAFPARFRTASGALAEQITLHTNYRADVPLLSATTRVARRMRGAMTHRPMHVPPPTTPPDPDPSAPLPATAPDTVSLVLPASPADASTAARPDPDPSPSPTTAAPGVAQPGTSAVAQPGALAVAQPGNSAVAQPGAQSGASAVALSGVDSSVADRDAVTGVGTAGSAAAGVADDGLGPAAVVRTFRSPTSEAAYVAHALREAYLLHGVPWSRMAVVLRSTSLQLPSLQRALTAAGVPTVTYAEDLPLHLQPAVAPFLLLLRCALDPAALNEEAAVALLHSPLGGADPLAERRLRQGLRALALAAGDRRPSGELLVDAVRDPAGLDLVERRWALPAQTVARLVATAREAAAVPGATAEQVLWTVWRTSGLADRWYALSTRNAPAPDNAEAGRARQWRAEAADRDLDSMVVLFDTAARFVDRLPGARTEVFLDHVLGQDLPADSIAPSADRGDAVRLLTAHAAKGLEWEVVVLAGVQEGIWPDLRLRGSLLGSERLVDVLAGRAVSRTAAVVGQTSALLDEERRLFYVAATRARRKLIVTAVASAGVGGSDGEEQPSRFLTELALPDPRPGDNPTPPPPDDTPPPNDVPPDDLPPPPDDVPPSDDTPPQHDVPRADVLPPSGNVSPSDDTPPSDDVPPDDVPPDDVPPDDVPPDDVPPDDVPPDDVPPPRDLASHALSAIQDPWEAALPRVAEPLDDHPAGADDDNLTPDPHAAQYASIPHGTAENGGVEDSGAQRARISPDAVGAGVLGAVGADGSTAGAVENTATTGTVGAAGKAGATGKAGAVGAAGKAGVVEAVAELIDEAIELPVGRPPRALTLAALVAELRTVVVGFDQTPSRRRAAAAELARLAAAGVPGAHPDEWWGLRSLSDDRPLVDEGEPVKVTPSSMESAMRCSLRWLLERHGGAAPAGPAQGIGNLVHAAAMLAEDANVDREKLVEYVSARFDAIELAARWLAGPEHDRAQGMVDKLLRWLAVNPRRLLAIEHEFTVRLEDEKRPIQLTGRVDRLEIDDEGRLVVIDLKTGKTTTVAADIDDHAQLAGYQAAVDAGAFEDFGRESGGAALVQLGTTKDAREQMQLPLSDSADPEWAYAMVRRTAETMAAATFSAVANSKCRVCPVRTSCPVSGKGRQVVDLGMPPGAAGNR